VGPENKIAVKLVGENHEKGELHWGRNEIKAVGELRVVEYGTLRKTSNLRSGREQKRTEKLMLISDRPQSS